MHTHTHLHTKFYEGKNEQHKKNYNDNWIVVNGVFTVKAKYIFCVWNFNDEKCFILSRLDCNFILPISFEIKVESILFDVRLYYYFFFSFVW